ncbi:cupin domain-containing protein [Lentzea sp. BCCO 10_0856]|uniref:Cupin domain-containing protein n=1 Tax=Lentzea miocenica TaxID=3095431 RepID=A0ABU4T8E3_9PSEU|nr:cupin domain-containing protein [Lentzea sp. BCCO 10_0856]MDX8034442.1 cupin domain-containing protein [Lentzea sp. BCCO 10_0856]
MRIVSAVVAALLLFSGVASATPSRGVTGTILAQWSAGGRDYTLREIVIDPGGSTGWHNHDGTLYAFVKKGVLTRTLGDCTTTFVHHRGDALVEEPNHVHIGRNLGTSPMVLEVLYVNPPGAPLSRDEPNPGCSFE